MVRFDEALKQISAVWDMTVNRNDWRRRLDTSEDGVFQSFWAIVYTAPLAVALYALVWKLQENIRRDAKTALTEFSMHGLTLESYFSIQILSFIGTWIGSIVLLASLARSLQRDKEAGLGFVAFNWAQVLLTFAQVLCLSLITSIPLYNSAVVLISAVYLLTAYVYWAIIKRTFERDTGITVAIIVMFILVKITVTSIATVFVGGIGLSI